MGDLDVGEPVQELTLARSVIPVRHSGWRGRSAPEVTPLVSWDGHPTAILLVAALTGLKH